MDGIINGTFYSLQLDYKTILFGTAASFSVEQSLRDITVRETNNWKTQLPGVRSWSMEFEGKLAYRFVDGTSPAWNKRTINDVYTLGIATQDRVNIKIKGSGTGYYYWEGECYITGISIDAPNEDNTTMKISFTGVNQLGMGYISSN
tara:strand:- start:9273 stop:9713 length:441 start_codon:yes stop_codon:yes gene_type:complete